MMMDASDVLFVGGAQAILDAYQKIGAPIVASAELGCAPQGSGLEDLLICADDGNDAVYPRAGMPSVRCKQASAIFKI